MIIFSKWPNIRYFAFWTIKRFFIVDLICSTIFQQNINIIYQAWYTLISTEQFCLLLSCQNKYHFQFLWLTCYPSCVLLIFSLYELLFRRVETQSEGILLIWAPNNYRNNTISGKLSHINTCLLAHI